MRTLRGVLLVGSLVWPWIFNPVRAADQVSQTDIAERLIHGPRRGFGGALQLARAIGVSNMSQKLRAAIIARLELEGDLNAQRRRGEIEVLENVELISGLAQLVSEFQDPASIPALTGALGTSPPAMFALANFGGPAAQSLVEVAVSTDDASIAMDALTSLRLMVDARQERPLSNETMDSIRRVAEARLTGKQQVTTLWRAIDLAVAIKDPALLRTVDLLASDHDAVVARGITDPALIDATQKLAADRLSGILPLPRR